MAAWNEADGGVALQWGIENQMQTLAITGYGSDQWSSASTTYPANAGTSILVVFSLVCPADAAGSFAEICIDTVNFGWGY